MSFRSSVKHHRRRSCALASALHSQCDSHDTICAPTSPQIPAPQRNLEVAAATFAADPPPPCLSKQSLPCSKNGHPRLRVDWDRLRVDRGRLRVGPGRRGVEAPRRRQGRSSRAVVGRRARVGRARWRGGRARHEQGGPRRGRYWRKLIDALDAQLRGKGSQERLATAKPERWDVGRARASAYEAAAGADAQVRTETRGAQ